MGAHSNKNLNGEHKSVKWFRHPFVQTCIGFAQFPIIFCRSLERHLAFHIVNAPIDRYPDVRLRSFDIRTTYSCFRLL
jgi:hypothetical protein